MHFFIKQKSMKLILTAILAAAEFLFFTGVPFAQSVYRRPHEVLDEKVIAEAEANLASDQPEPDRIIRTLSEELAKYTAQFVENKTIADERRYEALSYENINPDSSRLIHLYRKNKYDRTFYFGESPYLSRIHRALGKAWDLQGKNQKAVNSYFASIRYVSLDPECAGGEPSEKEYLTMARSFSETDRILQSAGDADNASASEARRLISGYADLKKRYEESIRRIDTARARAVRRIPGETEAEARADYERIKSEYDASVSGLSDIYKNTYLPFCKNRRSRTAETLYRIARLSKSISEKAESENLKNYADMLELAHSLDANNAVYLNELISYYKNTGDKRRAIDLNEKLVSILEIEKSDNLPEQYFRIAGLYSDTQNYILSAENYEKYLEGEKNPELRKRALVPLADLHYRRTGNLDRSLELYEEYLSAPAEERKYPYRLVETEVRFDAYVKMSYIYRRKQRTEKEKESLSNAVLAFRLLEEDRGAILGEKDKLQIEINTLKKELFEEEEDTPELRRYYRLLRIELPRLEREDEQYRIRLDAMHVENVLERMAVLARYERQFTRAVELYTEIVMRGRGKERDRARINIERIQLTMKDGIYREPALPPEFER